MDTDEPIGVVRVKEKFEGFKLCTVVDGSLFGHRASIIVELGAEQGINVGCGL